MGGVVSKVFGGDDAADSAKDAAAIQAQSQQEALAYLKEREKIPQELREQALQRLGGMYGLPGGVSAGQQRFLIGNAMGNPLYNWMMRGLESGEEAIMRRAAATGGLRSGNVQDALAKHAIDLRTKALLTSYQDQLQGLRGMAQLPSNAPQIASTIAGIGGTQAAGITAAEQARQDAMSNFLNTGIGIAGLFF